MTHGYYTAKKKMTSSSIYFQSLPYQVVPETGLIDYDGLAKNANLFKPRMVVCGASAYPRDWDYKTLRAIADKNGSYLLSDMAHISGLVAGKVQNSPFEYCDVVTTTTHKTLRGPRAGLIFFRKDKKDDDLEAKINAAVFPACQGGPHNNVSPPPPCSVLPFEAQDLTVAAFLLLCANQTIAAIAVALKQVASPAWKTYAGAVIDNARALSAALLKDGPNYKLQTGGSDNHLVLWDLRPLGLTGSKIEKICDLAHITVNKNAVAGDSAFHLPSPFSKVA